jgi:hypothetical protein
MLASEKPARDAAPFNRERRAASGKHFSESTMAALMGAIQRSDATLQAATPGLPSEVHAPDDGSEKSYREALAAWKAHVERQEEERKEDAERSRS